MSSRDIGKMGESHFENLCNQVDITANQSNPDRYGWDYLLEFPKDENSQLSLDMQDLPIECKVQVKASDTNSGKCQIKLSAIERLVKSSNPAFIYFVNYNNQYNPKEAFLLHIDENIIEQVLQRIRKNEASKTKKSLNQIRITIKYNESHRLMSIKGSMLKKEIEKYIPNGMKSYIEDKSKTIQAIGYDKHPMTLKMTILKEHLEDFANASLGLKDEEIPIKINDMFMNRFNIAIPFPYSLAGKENITMRVKPSKQEDVVVSFRKNGNVRVLMKVNMELYRQAVYLEDKQKIVLRNNIFEIEFTPIRMNVKFLIKRYEDKMFFDDLYNLLKFFKIADTYHKSLTISIEGNSLELTNIPISVSRLDNVNEMLIYSDIIERLKKIYNELSLELNFMLSLTELSSMQEYINVLYVALFEFKDNGISLNFSIENSTLTKLSSVPDNGVMIVPMLLCFNQIIFGIYIIYNASIDKEDTNIFALNVENIRDVEVFEYKLENFSEKDIISSSQSITDNLESGCTYAIVNEYIKSFEVENKFLLSRESDSST